MISAAAPEGLPSKRTIDRTYFFDALRVPLFGGSLSQGQVDGCTAILDAWEKYQPAAPREFLAYILATAFHETARTLQPIVEYGMGRGHAYGVPTGIWHQAYYGRGDVQLTWQQNYAYATARLQALKIIGDDLDLEKDASLALRPDLAAAILIYGLIEGWFTGKELDDYIDAKDFPDYAREDFVDARAVVNGHDRAALIAAYAMKILPALRQKEG